jgi:hypothetical protein
MPVRFATRTEHATLVSPLIQLTTATGTLTVRVFEMIAYEEKADRTHLLLTGHRHIEVRERISDIERLVRQASSSVWTEAGQQQLGSLTSSTPEHGEFVIQALGSPLSALGSVPFCFSG